MNVLETMLMQALAQAVGDNPAKPEERLANEEGLTIVSKIDPARCRGLLIMAVQDVEKEGHMGLELVSSMVGSESLLDLLANAAQAIITAQHMQRCHPDEVAAHPLLGALLNGSSVEADTVDTRYSSGDNPKH